VTDSWAETALAVATFYEGHQFPIMGPVWVLRASQTPKEVLSGMFTIIEITQ